MEYEQVEAAVFTAVADPTRRRILDSLRAGPRCVGDVVLEQSVAQPSVSKHLKVLRDAGLVRVRVEGRHRWYELAPDPLADLDGWLAPYREIWSDRLDALEAHLVAMEQT